MMKLANSILKLTLEQYIVPVFIDCSLTGSQLMVVHLVEGFKLPIFFIFRIDTEALVRYIFMNLWTYYGSLIYFYISLKDVVFCFSHFRGVVSTV